jgi:DNA-binding GntR family transcriptional regulator
VYSEANFSTAKVSPRFDVDRQFEADIAWFFDNMAPSLEKLSVEEHLRSGYLGNMDMRLRGTHQKGEAILANDLACQRLQVFVVEFLIELRPRVDDTPVDRRTDGDGSRPVLGSQQQFQGA